MTNERRCWEDLANAIILQAIEDWKNGNEENRDAINNFFNSFWFSLLTNVEADIIIYGLYKWLHEEELKGLKKRKAGK